MEITTIVITGGPCAGKTTAMDWIRRDITAMGYRVLIVPETATELISGGVCPWTCGSNYEYQIVQMRLQEEKERCFRQAAETMGSQCDRLLLVCDRGQFDNKVYMSAEEFSSIMERMGMDESTVRSRYDAIFHLVTAAIGTEAFSTDLNNSARYEDEDRVREMDRQFIDAWAGHPHHFYISSEADFDHKMKILINGIADFLREEHPYPEAPLPDRAIL